jgi:hypothetical protein
VTASISCSISVDSCASAAERAFVRCWRAGSRKFSLRHTLARSGSIRARVVLSGWIWLLDESCSSKSLACRKPNSLTFTIERRLNRMNLIGGRGPLADNIPDPILEQLLELFLLALPDEFETVQLKQFRDLPNGACFQAVVNTPFSFAPSSIGAVKPLPAVSITVNEYDSLKIPTSLGLQPNTPLQPLLQYSVSLDMRMDNGSNLFVNG